MMADPPSAVSACPIHTAVFLLAATDECTCARQHCILHWFVVIPCSMYVSTYVRTYILYVWMDGWICFECTYIIALCVCMYDAVQAHICAD